MPEHLRALVVILACAAVVFMLAERALCPEVVSQENFRRRRNAWFAVTLIAFLSHDFWLFVMLTALVVTYYRLKDSNPLALYFTILFAVPWYAMRVPGFGLVNYFVSLDYYRLLNLTVLLPLAVSLIGRHGPRLPHARVADLLLLTYLAYTFAMRLPSLSLTSGMRTIFDMAVDVWLPYFVASRALADHRSWREVFAALAVAAAVLGAMAPLETVKGWLLYQGLRPALDVPAPTIGVYILRGEGGALRANGSVGNSIVLGYLMMIALLAYLYLMPVMRRKQLMWLGLAVLVAGLVSALSRGPWVGAVVGMLVALAFGPGSAQRMVYAGAALLCGLVVIWLVPGTQKLLDFLPFIGSVDEGSVTYRQQLFTISMSVFWNSPWFGSLDYIADPVMEELRQGQGIIDMVNTYLAVALPYGAIGLALFCAPFAWALWACRSAMSATGSAETHRLGRVLLSAMLAMLVTIATVSSISVVAPMYWLLTGLCIAVGTPALSRTSLTRGRTPAIRPQPPHMSAAHH